MFARVTSFPVKPGTMEEAIHILVDSVVPAACQEKVGLTAWATQMCSDFRIK